MSSLLLSNCMLRTVCRRSSFAAAVPKNRKKQVISLDQNAKENERGERGGKAGGEGRKLFSAGSIAMLIIPATTFCLGCWQTYRLRWKLNLIEQLKQQLNEPAVDFPLNDLSKLNNMEYRRVRLRGEFLHNKEFHIAPRGRFDPGYEEKSAGSLLSSDNLSSHGAHIITPFRIAGSNLVVMVNRGWVPASKISASSRASSQPKGVVTLEAVVRKSEKRPQFVSDNVPERGLWFYKDFDQMAKQYNTDPIYLEAVYESTVPGGPIGGQSNVNVRNEHLQYLLTWFSLSAITLAISYLVPTFSLSDSSHNVFILASLFCGRLAHTQEPTKMCALFRGILVIFLISVAAFICFAEDQSFPDDWTDPNDPTYHNTHALGQIADIANGVQTCEQYDPTLRLILRQMFRELGVDISEKAFFSRKATVSLSSFNMKIVGSYLEGENFADEPAIREQVRGALHGMITVDDKEVSTSMWQRLVTIVQPWISLLNMIILPPAVFFILRNVMSKRSLLSSIVLLFFIVSMITTYNRMYQQKLAHRIAEAVKRKEDACAPSTLLEQSMEYLTSFFTFRKKSSCVSFIESQTVSIVSEISLLDVFSDVLSNSIFGILGNIGRHTNRFFREFFDGVPIPVMLLMAIILIFSTVRIKTPLFTFEPLLLTSLRHATSSMIHYIDGPNRGTRGDAMEHRPFIQVGDEDMHALDNHFINRGRNPLRHRRAKATAAIPAVSSADTPLSRESSLDSSPSLSSSRSRSLPR